MNPAEQNLSLNVLKSLRKFKMYYFRADYHLNCWRLTSVGRHNLVLSLNRNKICLLEGPYATTPVLDGSEISCRVPYLSDGESFSS